MLIFDGIARLPGLLFLMTGTEKARPVSVVVYVASLSSDKEAFLLYADGRKVVGRYCLPK